jgi:hypothetical protein
LEDTTIEDVLKTFQDFYVKKDYDNALLTLQKEGGQLPPGLLHYNLGTVHAKKGDFPLARYHLLQAERAGFSGSNLYQNLNLVENELEAGKLEEPISATDHFVRVANFVSYGILTSLSLLVLIFGLLILKRHRSWIRVIIFLVLFFIPLSMNWWINSWPRAVNMEEQEILEGPSAIFSPVGVLPAGVLIIAEDKGAWSKIIYPTRYNGWTKSKRLKKLE